MSTPAEPRRSPAATPSSASADGRAAARSDTAVAEVTPVPAFADNYIWLVHGLTDRTHVAVVDPGDARPVLEALAARGLRLDAILVTHHHADHVGGVETLVERTGAPVYGPAGESIPRRTTALVGGDYVKLESLSLGFQVIDVPGHTAGHIAYHGHGSLFCGDTLFSGGCGRLFEGTPAQMLDSLDRLRSLPPDTRMYCAHEYTASNLRFALAVEPVNADLVSHADLVAQWRANGRPSVPTTLGLERRINPFLRTREATVRAAAERRAGRALADDVDAFAVVREWKNEFR